MIFIFEEFLFLRNIPIYLPIALLRSDHVIIVKLCVFMVHRHFEWIRIVNEDHSVEVDQKESKGINELKTYTLGCAFFRSYVNRDSQGVEHVVYQ